MTRGLVQRLRRERPQPWWPRLVGVACLLSAGWFALHPVGLLVAAMSSAVPASGPKSPVAEPLGEAGEVLAATAPLVFTWQPGTAEAPFTWVLLDAAYEELERREGLDGTCHVPDADERSHWQDGATCHWFVIGQARDGLRASQLETVRIAAPGSDVGIAR